MMNKIFKQIKQHYPKINNTPKIVYNNSIPYDFLLSQFSGNYSFSKVNNYIRNCKKYMIMTYKNIKLHIIYKTNNEINISKLIKTIMRAYTMIKINNNSHNNFNIYILMSPYKRFLPKTGIIEPEHINGGFTQVNYNNSKNIFISRKEEYSKVLLHEIIHHFDKINNNDDWGYENIKKLKEYFKISDKTLLNPNEAIVELWATIYNILFISYEYKLPYNMLLKKEIINSLKQSYKLILFQKNKEWFEKTNSYCYIIFKTILLYNFNKLIKIYTFPYNTNMITDFLIKYSNLPLKKINIYEPSYRKTSSLCMMMLSDF